MSTKASEFHSTHPVQAPPQTSPWHHQHPAKINKKYGIYVCNRANFHHLLMRRLLHISFPVRWRDVQSWPFSEGWWGWERREEQGIPGWTLRATGCRGKLPGWPYTGAFVLCLPVSNIHRYQSSKSGPKYDQSINQAYLYRISQQLGGSKCFTS